MSAHFLREQAAMKRQIDALVLELQQLRSQVMAMQERKTLHLKGKDGRKGSDGRSGADSSD